MPEGNGAYVAAFVVIVIIIFLLVFFFFNSCGGSSLIPCLTACRICAKADSNQIQLGKCCEAKITNSVAQPTVYTLPDPGTDAASFLLSVGSGQTLNGNALVTSSGGAGDVSGDAVTINGPSGVITAPLGTLAADTNLTDFTFTNSSIKSDSVLLLTTNVAPSTVPAIAPAGAAAITYAVTQSDGSAVLRVRNVGTAAFSSQFATISFLVA